MYTQQPLVTDSAYALQRTQQPSVTGGAYTPQCTLQPVTNSANTQPYTQQPSVTDRAYSQVYTQQPLVIDSVYTNQESTHPNPVYTGMATYSNHASVSQPPRFDHGTSYPVMEYGRSDSTNHSSTVTSIQQPVVESSIRTTQGSG
ncbi:protein transport protein SEC24-like [Mercenaria mercenaria]|uniref:protein transport protein SEC24-like n=1 Tax=Mercenaria mercenaria TaxID=6596 RepID=UPI00234E606A|nr:protein transport protein SEC24-like [Mercenaria mercenaria]